MVKYENSPEQFDSIWRSYEIAVKLMPLKDPQNRPKTKSEKVRFWLLVAGIVHIIVSSFVQFPRCLRNDPAEAVVLGFCLMGYLFFSIMLLLLYLNQDEYQDLLKWCEGLHLRPFPVSSGAAREKLRKCLESSRSTFNKAVFYLPFGMTTVGLLEQVCFSVYKGYFAPTIKFEVMWAGKERWFNVGFIQLNAHTSAFVIITAECLMFTIMWMTLEHLFAILDIMEALLGLLKPPVPEKVFRQVMKELTEIQGSLVETELKLQRLSRWPVLMNEVTFYSVLLMLWVTAFHFQDQLYTGFSASSTALPFFVLTWMNERLIDAHEDLRFAIYDLPWYEMEPSQRRILVPVMAMLDRPSSLMAGPFHEISFNQLSVMLNRVYSYGLTADEFIEGQKT